MAKPSVTVLCGGYGGARFIDGLKYAEINGTCIVNTADDLTKFKLKICPDIDSVIYSLTDRFDEFRGYGIKNDTFYIDRIISKIAPQWFHIGDRDMLTHLYRTIKLLRHNSLTELTKSLTKKHNAIFNVFPMTDDDVETVVTTEFGDMSFQEFIVKYHAEPKIANIRYQGIQKAVASPQLLDHIESAELVIIGPSSPVASILPILSTAGIRPSLIKRTGPTVAISPMIINKEPDTLAQIHRANLRNKFMNAIGLEHTPFDVAKLYRDFIDVFVIDFVDSEFKKEIEALGLSVIQTDLLAVSGVTRVAAVNTILKSSLAFNKIQAESITNG